MKRIDVLHSIIAKNGPNYQMGVVIEELAELTKELTKFQRGKPHIMKICEEIADVEICLEQLKIIIEPCKEQIAMYKRFKIERLRKLYVEGNET